MRIGIMGAGLIGGYVGGCLAAAGHDVHFVARPAMRAAWERDGLTLSDAAGRTHRLAPASLTVQSHAAGLGAAEVVLVTVKSGHSREAGEALRGRLGPNACVVSLQNGVEAAASVEAALGARVLRGMVSFNVVARTVSHLHQATTGPIVLEDAPAGRRVAAALRAAGMAARVDGDMAAVQWGKLVLNLNNAVNALSGRPLREQLGERGYRRVLAACMDEAVRVLDAARITPRIEAPLPLRFVPRVLRLPTPLFRAAAASMLRIDPSARSSMLEDLTARRPTEVDWLNGAIVRLAAQHGVEAKLNDAMAALVHESEGRGSPGLSPAQLTARLAPYL